MELFKQSLICPHCRHEFSAVRHRVSSVVQRGAIFVCPQCNQTFGTPLRQQLFPRAKPWPWWAFVLMLAGIVVLLMGPLLILSRLIMSVH